MVISNYTKYDNHQAERKNRRAAILVAVNPQGSLCQNCNQYGHSSYECNNRRRISYIPIAVKRKQYNESLEAAASRRAAILAEVYPEGSMSIHNPRRKILIPQSLKKQILKEKIMETRNSGSGSNSYSSSSSESDSDSESDSGSESDSETNSESSEC